MEISGNIGGFAPNILLVIHLESPSVFNSLSDYTNYFKLEQNYLNNWPAFKELLQVFEILSKPVKGL